MFHLASVLNAFSQSSKGVLNLNGYNLSDEIAINQVIDCLQKLSENKLTEVHLWNTQLNNTGLAEVLQQLVKHKDSLYLLELGLNEFSEQAFSKTQLENLEKLHKLGNLSIARNNLGNNVIKNICQYLVGKPLWCLEFGANRLDASCLTAIAHVIKKIPLEGYKGLDLHLWGNRLEYFNNECVQTLLDFKELRTLNLGGNHLTDESGYQLADIIAANPKISYLELWRNPIGGMGGQRLAESMVYLPDLLGLNWWSARVGSEIAGLLANSLQTNNQLEILDLGENPFQLADILPALTNKSNLKLLHLGGINDNTQGLAQLLSQLTDSVKPNCMEKLVLWSHQPISIDDAIAKKLSQLLLNQQHKLQVLDLGNFNFSKVLRESSRAANAISQCHRLKELSIWGNHFSSAELSLVLQHKTQLRKLNLSFNELATDKVNVINNALAAMVSLDALDLKETAINEANLKHLVDNLPLTVRNLTADHPIDYQIAVERLAAYNDKCLPYHLTELPPNDQAAGDEINWLKQQIIWHKQQAYRIVFGKTHVHIHQFYERSWQKLTAMNHLQQHNQTEQFTATFGTHIAVYNDKHYLICYAHTENGMEFYAYDFDNNWQRLSYNDKTLGALFKGNLWQDPLYYQSLKVQVTSNYLFCVGRSADGIEGFRCDLSLLQNGEINYIPLKTLSALNNTEHWKYSQLVSNLQVQAYENDLVLIAHGDKETFIWRTVFDGQAVEFKQLASTEAFCPHDAVDYRATLKTQIFKHANNPYLAVTCRNGKAILLKVYDFINNRWHQGVQLNWFHDKDDWLQSKYYGSMRLLRHRLDDNNDNLLFYAKNNKAGYAFSYDYQNDNWQPLPPLSRKKLPHYESLQAAQNFLEQNKTKPIADTISDASQPAPSLTAIEEKLFAACARGDLATFKLLKSGATFKADLKDSDGNTLLHVAVSHNHPVLVHKLLEDKPDLTVINKAGLTAAALAVKYNNALLLQLFELSGQLTEVAKRPLIDLAIKEQHFDLLNRSTFWDSPAHYRSLQILSSNDTTLLLGFAANGLELYDLKQQIGAWHPLGKKNFASDVRYLTSVLHNTQLYAVGYRANTYHVLVYNIAENTWSTETTFELENLNPKNLQVLPFANGLFLVSAWGKQLTAYQISITEAPLSKTLAFDCQPIGDILTLQKVGEQLCICAVTEVDELKYQIEVIVYNDVSPKSIKFDLPSDIVLGTLRSIALTQEYHHCLLFAYVVNNNLQLTRLNLNLSLVDTQWYSQTLGTLPANWIVRSKILQSIRFTAIGNYLHYSCLGSDSVDATPTLFNHRFELSQYQPIATSIQPLMANPVAIDWPKTLVAPDKFIEMHQVLPQAFGKVAYTYRTADGLVLEQPDKKRIINNNFSTDERITLATIVFRDKLAITESNIQLDLSGLQLTEVTFELCLVLAEAYCIEKLLFQQCNLTEQQVTRLGQWLANNSNLLQLDLANNHLSLQAIQALAEGVKANRVLEELILDNTQLNQQAWEQLCHALAIQPALETISIKGHPDLAIKAPLEEMLQTNFCLKQVRCDQILGVNERLTTNNLLSKALKPKNSDMEHEDSDIEHEDSDIEHDRYLDVIKKLSETIYGTANKEKLITFWTERVGKTKYSRLVQLLDYLAQKNEDTLINEYVGLFADQFPKALKPLNHLIGDRDEVDFNLLAYLADIIKLNKPSFNALLLTMLLEKVNAMLTKHILLKQPLSKDNLQKQMDNYLNSDHGFDEEFLSEAKKKVKKLVKQTVESQPALHYFATDQLLPVALRNDTFISSMYNKSIGAVAPELQNKNSLAVSVRFVNQNNIIHALMLNQQKKLAHWCYQPTERKWQQVKPRDPRFFQSHQPTEMPTWHNPKQFSSVRLAALPQNQLLAMGLNQFGLDLRSYHQGRWQKLGLLRDLKARDEDFARSLRTAVLGQVLYIAYLENNRLCLLAYQENDWHREHEFIDGFKNINKKLTKEAEIHLSIAQEELRLTIKSEQGLSTWCYKNRQWQLQAEFVAEQLVDASSQWQYLPNFKECETTYHKMDWQWVVSKSAGKLTLWQLNDNTWRAVSMLPNKCWDGQPADIQLQNLQQVTIDNYCILIEQRKSQIFYYVYDVLQAQWLNFGDGKVQAYGPVLAENELMHFQPISVEQQPQLLLFTRKQNKLECYQGNRLGYLYDHLNKRAVAYKQSNSNVDDPAYLSEMKLKATANSQISFDYPSNDNGNDSDSDESFTVANPTP